MASWRDGVSGEAQGDVDALLDLTVGFGREQLTKWGEIYPYGALVGLDGEARLLMPDMGGNDHPSSDDVMGACIEGLLTELPTIRATALVADVTVTELATDALRVDVQHREGAAVRFLAPYSKRRLRKDLYFGEIEAQTGPRLFWS